MPPHLSLLCLAAFAAGFIDAIVGGGGLIQTPASLVLLRQYPVATVIGTLKIPAFCGTGMAALQYGRRVQLQWGRLAAMASLAAVAAFAGSRLLTLVSNQFMKPLLLIVLVAVAAYTWTNKKFGHHTEKKISPRGQWARALAISGVIGFYDGFIGPGAGTFLVLAFIGWMGFDFLKASAHAKFINLSTNLGSIIFFALSGKIIYAIALPMAVCNAVGGALGARMAILKGNAFIRILFLIVICGIILRFAHDVFFP